ncbi:DUF4864 domain-containing protein [Hahella ganghwensis]|uniref:DUF4864 domain-containing protein n=1 Tax=Hahella ganghwensis TaxID=286420 RepID=UPI0003A67253|nr:DUF4864 domain-containing protein [Hahella ganghwensis]
MKLYPYCMWLALVLVATAEPSPAEEYESTMEREMIIAVIQTQIDAFQSGDVITAFMLASPDVKRSLITAENFINMVRYHYSAVYRPQSVTYLELEVAEPYRVQHLMIIGPEGYGWDAYYIMEQQSDGRWTIAGVHLFKREDIPV